MPYSFIASDESVAERVCSGERLVQPNGCPDALWTSPLSLTQIAPELSLIRAAATPLSQSSSMELLIKFLPPQDGSRPDASVREFSLRLERMASIGELKEQICGVICEPLTSRERFLVGDSLRIAASLPTTTFRMDQPCILC